MLSNRFVITQLDLGANYGIVRQVVPADDVLLDRPIGFVVSGVAQAFYDEEGHGCGIRIPDKALRDRIPVVGEELVGFIACDTSGAMAFDLGGNPFLRNWAYADQYDAVQAIVDGQTEPDDYDPRDDEEDDTPSTSEVYSRALRHFGGNHELAREATSQYPGDFI